MFDTIINIIQWGHFVGFLVLLVLYFTTPYILRKYVFTIDEDGNKDENEDGDTEENKVKYDLTSSVEDKLAEENNEEKEIDST